MKILALESSAKAASVAVCQDETPIALSYQESGLTHSATLLPMVVDLLKNAGLSLEEMDVVAVAAGPGSFTGVRIGVAAAKGLCWQGNKPCAACSTLESMAWLCAHMDGEICSVMDARRNQVYAARFLGGENSLTRLSEDKALSLTELAEEARQSGGMRILVGDGAELCAKVFTEAGIPVKLAPPHLLRQNAWGVARCALELARAGRLLPAGEVRPAYHRLSQAERERLAAQTNQAS